MYSCYYFSWISAFLYDSVLMIKTRPHNDVIFENHISLLFLFFTLFSSFIMCSTIFVGWWCHFRTYLYLYVCFFFIKTSKNLLSFYHISHNYNRGYMHSQLYFCFLKAYCMRGFGSMAKLPMKFLVNTLFLFIKKYTLLRIAVPYLICWSKSTAKLPMEFLVNTLFPFIKRYALLRIAVPYF